jgi:thiamine-phosphate pyrophosphorylase
VGQDDASVEEARAVLGANAIIGQSTHSEEQIAAADARDIDYFAVGPVWETPTKPGRAAVGLELVTHASQVATKPFFAIGGIGPLNAGQVVAAGARRLCVVRAIRDAPHPEVAAEALRRSFEAEGSTRGVAPGG